jgi:hypothetical protein
MEEKQKDVVWPIRMSQELKDEFKIYCDGNGYSIKRDQNAKIVLNVKPLIITKIIEMLD